MVARSPPKQQRRTAVMVEPPPLSPTLLRETVKKVDRCMARLQELQYTVAGGKKLTYCGRNNLRFKNANSQRSPPGKLPTNTEEWRRMSLPAMLLGETIGEILQASQFARNIVEVVSSKAAKPIADDPKTPLTERRKHKPTVELSELHARRKKEKQVVLQSIRSESNVPTIHRAKSRINFKTSPECNKENCRYIANRISPRNRPWVKKTVLFPNPLFHSSPTSKHQKFSKTKSPVIVRSRQTPHKFFIKSPPTSASKFQVKIKGPPVSISPRGSAAAKLRRSFSPSRLANKFVSPLRNRNDGRKNEGNAIATMRRSFSPSRLANKLVSPLRNRKIVQRNEGVVFTGLKQRPSSSLDRFPPRRI